MKKGFVITLVAVGSALLLSGGVMFAIGVANSNQNSSLITKEHEVSTFSKVNIDVSISDLYFKISEDAACKVVCQEKEKVYHTVEVKDDTLYIQGFDTRQWFEKTFNFFWKPISVTIYLPSGNLDEVKIDSSTGDIHIPESYFMNNLDITLSTGNVSIASNVAEKVHIKASTGDIHYAGNAKDIHLEASTGKVKLSNSLSEKLKINTSTGDIIIRDSDASNSIDIEASTGDVDAEFLSAKEFDVHASTGNISIPSSVSGATPCRIHTSTGDIKVTIK